MPHLTRLLVCQLLLLSLAGCQKFSLRSQNPDDDDDVAVAKTTYIGDQVSVTGLHPIMVESVALVVGLDGTGGDSPPSMYRTLLLDDMRKQGVTNPNTLLRSPDAALVVVRASIPPVIHRGERFDLEVVLPESAEATSLKDGFLLRTAMSEQALIPGRGPAKGHTLAVGEGPLLLSTGEGDSSSLAGVLKRARVLGGAEYVGGILKKDRELGLYVRSDMRSVRQTRRIADAIGKRFHDFDHGIKRPLAKAMTDQHIELRVHSRYKENYIRYVQVVRHIALNEKAVEERERLERLRRTLLVPQTASRSATELEAIGAESILILKEGLRSPDPEVRFYSADALAYLGDSAGSQILADAARHEEAFRVFAFAAMATLTDDAVTRDFLCELMSEPTIEEAEGGVTKEVWSAETRYGAFHTLWTMNKNDDFIRGEPINKGDYTLHLIKSPGEELVHLTTHRVPQVVVFGADQRLRTPINLSAGRHIVITAPAGSDTVTLSRFQAGRDDRQLTRTTRLADVIRGLGELDASYPDVAQMLVQANRQKNLMGRLELDALPQPGRYYHRAPSLAAGSDPEKSGRREKTRVGRANAMPNLFPAADKAGKSGADEDDNSEIENASGAGEASLADVSDSKEPAARKKRGLFGISRKQ